MSAFTNKHMIAALLIAPILAILAYFAVDQMVKPEAVVARSGDYFPLVAKSNCRYESGKCTLVNGEFRVDIRQQDDTAMLQLQLESELPIEGARFVVIDEQGNMLQTGVSEDGSWQLDPQKLDRAGQLQIAIRSQDVIYFVETQTSFIRGITG